MEELSNNNKDRLFERVRGSADIMGVVVLSLIAVAAVLFILYQVRETDLAYEQISGGDYTYAFMPEGDTSGDEWVDDLIAHTEEHEEAEADYIETISEEEANSITQDLNLHDIASNEETNRGDNWKVEGVSTWGFSNAPALVVTFGVDQKLQGWGDYSTARSDFYDTLREADYDPCGEMLRYIRSSLDREDPASRAWEGAHPGDGC